MLRTLRRRVGSWFSRNGIKPDGVLEPGNAGAAAAPEAMRHYQRGLQLLKESKAGEALACVEDAIAISPNFAEAHNCAGLALRKMHRHEQAIGSFQKAIAIEHDHVGALTNLGMTHLDLGRQEDASDCFNLALAFDPNCVAAHIGLGTLRRRQQRAADAIEHFERASELDPRSPVPVVSLNLIRQDLGQYEQALACLERALVLTPNVAELECNLGILLLRLERPQEAEVRLRRAITLKEDFPEAHFNLGTALLACENGDEATESYLRAIALRPDYREAHRNLGCAYRIRGELDKALAAYRTALALQPDDAQVQLDIGVVWYEQGRTQDAIASYHRALAIKPDFPEAQLNLGLAWLSVGDFERGWAGYERRFRQPAKDNRIIKRIFSCPEWRGEDLTGKSIVISGEQGIGDQLLFASLFGEIIRDARECVIECAGKLVPLLARSFPDASVVPLSNPPHAACQRMFDYHTAAGSVGRWRRRSLVSFPQRNDFLVADTERVAYWRGRLDGLGPGLRVGFSWRSTNIKAERALSCTRLHQWGPILRVRGVHFICLQYDECAAELAAAGDEFEVRLHAFQEVDLFNDLEEAAALTRAVDLVISAPTAVSMLAAALGVSTWQMSYGPHWQTHGAQANAWFPTMERYSRRWNQDWDEIVHDIAGRLAQCASRHGGLK